MDFWLYLPVAYPPEDPRNISRSDPNGVEKEQRFARERLLVSGSRTHVCKLYNIVIMILTVSVCVYIYICIERER